MRWDIFGRKKIEQRLQSLSADIQVLSDKFDQCKILLQEINNKAKSNYSLLDEKLDREFEKINKVTEIPLIKPIIRDAERAQKKERKDKAEFDTVNNIWKN